MSEIGKHISFKFVKIVLSSISFDANHAYLIMSEKPGELN